MQCHEFIPNELTENNDVPCFFLVHALGNHYTSQTPGSELHMESLPTSACSSRATKHSRGTLKPVCHSKDQCGSVYVDCMTKL